MGVFCWFSVIVRTVEGVVKNFHDDGFLFSLRPRRTPEEIHERSKKDVNSLLFSIIGRLTFSSRIRPIMVTTFSIKLPQQLLFTLV